jgi:hypothetical protein
MKVGSLEVEDQKSPKNAKMGILGQQGDTYVVVGRPSNLVYNVTDLLKISC